MEIKQSKLYNLVSSYERNKLTSPYINIQVI
ncbi:hypothetical protein F383_23088 [Gossypium arboreum]|uniref:Uncharacterized protein n=1 Tax=Gossypium arboreum TaxID=29729 RepID=A0A0B0P018_GOSAR|nr:hypothetical protein F383_23088 [Gossypium arboreum]